MPMCVSVSVRVPMRVLREEKNETEIIFHAVCVCDGMHIVNLDNGPCVHSIRNRVKFHSLAGCASFF